MQIGLVSCLKLLKITAERKKKYKSVECKFYFIFFNGKSFFLYINKIVIWKVYIMLLLIS